MPNNPVDDIPDIETKKLNFRKTSAKMDELIQTVCLPLNHPYCFKKSFDYQDELRSTLSHNLLIYKTTHRSMRVIIRHVARKKDYALVIDAASLVREQIEKIYSIALILSDPHRWVKQGLRSAWRSEYQGYLLEREEQGHIQRFGDFFDTEYVKYFKMTQRFPYNQSSAKKEVIVSDFAKRVLIYNWENPGGPKPVWLKPKKSTKKTVVKSAKPRKKRRSIRTDKVINYMIDYFDFPTPGKSIRHIHDPDMRSFLWRWHKEYGYFSQYTHAAFEKTVLPVFAEFKHLAAVEKAQIMAHKMIDRSAYTSFIATACACTLIVSQLKDDYGAKHLLKEFWEILCDGSFLAKSLWEIYPSKVIK